MKLDQISEAYLGMLDEAKTPFEIGDHHGYKNVDQVLRRPVIARFTPGSAEHKEYEKGVASGNARRTSLNKQKQA